VKAVEKEQRRRFGRRKVDLSMPGGGDRPRSELGKERLKSIEVNKKVLRLQYTIKNV